LRIAGRTDGNGEGRGRDRRRVGNEGSERPDFPPWDKKQTHDDDDDDDDEARTRPLLCPLPSPLRSSVLRSERVLAAT